MWTHGPIFIHLRLTLNENKKKWKQNEKNKCTIRQSCAQKERLHFKFSKEEPLQEFLVRKICEKERKNIFITKNTTLAERKRNIKEACNLDKNKPLTAVIVKRCSEIYLKHVICMYVCVYVCSRFSIRNVYPAKLFFSFVAAIVCTSLRVKQECTTP